MNLHLLKHLKNSLSIVFMLLLTVFFASCSEDPVGPEDSDDDNGSQPTAPAAPSDLLLSKLTSSSALVQWTDNSDNEDGFAIYLSGNNSQPAQAETNVSANVTTFTVSASAAETLYVWLEAYNSVGESSSIEDSVVLKSAPSAPASLILSGSPGESSATVNWSDVSDESGYALYYSNENTQPTAVSVALAADSISYTLNGLDASTQYFVWLEATNAYGASSATELSGGFTTEAAGVGSVALDAAVYTGNAATANISVIDSDLSSGTIDVTVSNAENNETISVTLTDNSGTYEGSFAFTIAASDDGADEISSLSGENIVVLYADASPVSTNRSVSAVWNDVDIGSESPAISSLAATGVTSLDIDWTSVDDADGYAVYIAEDGVSSQPLSPETSVSGTSYSYTIANQSGGNVISVWVVATNTGFSSLASTDSLEVGALPASAPAATLNGYAEAFDAEFADVTNAEGYLLVYRLEGDSIFTAVNPYQSGDIIDVGALSDNTNYEVQVVATNEYGVVSNSLDTVTVYKKPTAPFGGVASGDYTWTADTTNLVSGFAGNPEEGTELVAFYATSNAAESIVDPTSEATLGDNGGFQMTIDGLEADTTYRVWVYWRLDLSAGTYAYSDPVETYQKTLGAQVSFAKVEYVVGTDTDTSLTLFDPSALNTTVSVVVSNAGSDESISLDIATDGNGDGTGSLNFGATDDSSDTIAISDGDVLYIIYFDGSVNKTATSDVVGAATPPADPSATGVVLNLSEQIAITTSGVWFPASHGAAGDYWVAFYALSSENISDPTTEIGLAHASDATSGVVDDSNWTNPSFKVILASATATDVYDVWLYNYNANSDLFCTSPIIWEDQVISSP